MVKKYTSGSEDWPILDVARCPHTAHSQTIVWANSDAAEQNNGINRLRFSSTGFKITSTSGDPRWNSDGEKYIYMAFAEQPVKYKVGH